MKRILIPTLMTAVCAFTCAIGLTACGEHTHDYGTEWTTNATYHWHECTASGDCDAKEKDKAAHADNNGDGKCDVCDYNMGGGSQTVAVESISLNKSALTLNIGGEETLTVNYAPAAATDKTVTWSSSAPAVASVDNTGKITALTEGVATVTATTANNKTATCAVTVNASASLTEDTDFYALVSERVIGEQWAAAFDNDSFSNATIKHTNTYYERLQYWKKQTDGADTYLYMYSWQNHHEGLMGYFTVEDGNKYGYMPNPEDFNPEDENFNPDDLTFYRMDMSAPDKEEGFNWYLAYTISCPDFGDFFTEFAYDEETSAYVYNGDGIETNSIMDGENMDYTNISVKIINGKLAYISCTRVGGDDGLYEFFIYDYDTTTVTPPADYIEFDSSASD